MTVYAFLVEIGDRVFLDPITKYIVSLKVFPAYSRSY
jgi:hypothetical protein